MENVEVMETAAEIQQSVKLNQQQLEMLRVFKTPFPEDDFRELKGHIVQLLNKRLQEEMKQLSIENSWTSETFEQWGHDHDRISTVK